MQKEYYTTFECPQYNDHLSVKFEKNNPKSTQNYVAFIQYTFLNYILHIKRNHFAPQTSSHFG